MILECRRQYTQSLTLPPATIRYTGGINTTKSLRCDFSKMVKDRNLRFSPFKIISKKEFRSRRALKSNEYKLVKNAIENKCFWKLTKNRFFGFLQNLFMKHLVNENCPGLIYETSSERKLPWIVLN